MFFHFPGLNWRLMFLVTLYLKRNDADCPIPPGDPRNWQCLFITRLQHGAVHWVTKATFGHTEFSLGQTQDSNTDYLQWFISEVSPNTKVQTLLNFIFAEQCMMWCNYNRLHGRKFNKPTFCYLKKNGYTQMIKTHPATATRLIL